MDRIGPRAALRETFVLVGVRRCHVEPGESATWRQDQPHSCSLVRLLGLGEERRACIHQNRISVRN